jgi:hypothetical protein
MFKWRLEVIHEATLSIALIGFVTYYCIKFKSTYNIFFPPSQGKEEVFLLQ